jgi:outer membrane protein OmpA-like peptidoglycan-associated protein
MDSAVNGGEVCSYATGQIRILFAVLLALVLGVGLGGCTNGTAGSAPGSTTQAAPHTPHPIVPFNDAIADATEQMFQSFKMDGDNGTSPLPFVIDPLIDGATGAQSKATSHIQEKVLALAKTKYTRFQVQPFTGSALNSKPLVLIGTLNTINRAAEMKGNRTSWWLCVVLVDLRTGKVVAKGVALAQLDGVDITPLDYFKDSPAWSSADDATSTYVKNCQKSKVGDLVDPKYLDGLFASSLIAQAIEAYDKGQYQDALDLYKSAAASPGGDQLRLYVGLYLANQKLGDTGAEDDAFRRVVDFGLTHQRLAVKFLFRPSSTLFINDPKTATEYDMWLSQIAKEATARDVCLVVTGHTTPTGLPAINRELSVLRAEYIKDRLDTLQPPMTIRTIADGVGSRENLVGTGKDDDTDALDRRVEFKVIQSACATKTVEQYNVY